MDSIARSVIGRGVRGDSSGVGVSEVMLSGDASFPARRDFNFAMQKGVNYPRGPLRWADDIGVRRIRDVVQNLAAHYGADRYRLSPFIARRETAGQPLSAAVRTTSS